MRYSSSGARRLPPYVIAVASGKGGVGKSTVAANLAAALGHGSMADGSPGAGEEFGRKGEEEKGGIADAERVGKLRVGFADVDVFGPSGPTMFNLVGVPKPDIDPTTKMLDPVVNYGISISSVGFLAGEENAPAIWRGPLVMSMVKQLVWGVDWSGIDVLVIDTPPGTGDALLTLTQDVPLSGAILVSSPQDVALADAVKGANMFRKLGVPILGMVENMAYYQCSSCQSRDYLFGDVGPVQKLNARLEESGSPGDVRSLAEIPLSGPIAKAADAGAPIVLSQPDSPQAKAFKSLAANVRHVLSTLPTPRR